MSEKNREPQSNERRENENRRTVSTSKMLCEQKQEALRNAGLSYAVTRGGLLYGAFLCECDAEAFSETFSEVAGKATVTNVAKEVL